MVVVLLMTPYRGSLTRTPCTPSPCRAVALATPLSPPDCNVKVGRVLRRRERHVHHGDRPVARQSNQQSRQLNAGPTLEPIILTHYKSFNLSILATGNCLFGLTRLTRKLLTL